MNIDNVKEMFDGFYLAKRIRDLLPPLPDSINSSYIHYLDKIKILENREIEVRVSDLSDLLNLPRPGVTRTLKEMEKLDLIQKIQSKEDGRVVYIKSTEKGKKLREHYVSKYFEKLSSKFESISDEEVRSMIETIEKVYKIMVSVDIDFDNIK